jgi:SAM-dependent methyltransferase
MSSFPSGTVQPASVVTVGPEYADLVAFFDAFADIDDRWRLKNRTYHRLLEEVYRFSVPPGARVLEIGCGGGDLLAALRPSTGLGVDVSAGMIELARRRHPQLEFMQAEGETLTDGRVFDYIVLSDLVPYVHDLIALFDRVRAHSHSRTRVVINSYSSAWRPVLALAERLGLKSSKPVKNWVAPGDVENLLELSGFETVGSSQRILMPMRIPFLTTFLNGFVASLWPFNHLCVSYWIVARPRIERPGELRVSVVCPCRNEQGHIAGIVERLPAMGSATELIFVEGGSTDDTRGEIDRQLAMHPEMEISVIGQPGKGKGDAVRAGFAAARYELLMILDGDLSVRPEDLPKFYAALAGGHGELINGSRLVYDMEPGAMRFLNMLGNKAFSWSFKAITGHQVKDTLCGTKVLHRDDYASIVDGRSYFGEFDPFGDFDLLFGAARLSLKIIDVPVRYQTRVYGTTNISRFRHGLLLLRMTAFAFWKFRVALFRARPSA